MPPQQGNGLLDLVDRAFGLGAHLHILPVPDMLGRCVLVKALRRSIY
jgi:hypothetical protein